MEPSAAKQNATRIPAIHIVSDSMGLTARSVARAAAAQFGVTDPVIELCPQVNDIDQITEYLDAHLERHRALFGDERLILFYTLVDDGIRESFQDYLGRHPLIVAVDLVTEAIEAIQKVSGLVPSDTPGELHVTDENYFRRIDAMEFTIAHDDGRNPQDLSKADIVLLGVSRSSKTPTSIYLSQQGLKVANVPLDLQTQPPKEIYTVDSSRLFGLVTTPEVLIGIRQRRLGKALAVASDYADPEKVYEELDSARALMRRLGAIVVHTDNRAVEETAQTILRYYESMHPQMRSAQG